MSVTTRHQWTTIEVLAELARNREWLQSLGVRSLGLFGSYRRGTPQPNSDLDFLTDLEDPSFDGYMNLKFWLEDTFGLPVDLVLIDTLKPRLRPVITSEVIYAEGLSPVRNPDVDPFNLPLAHLAPSDQPKPRSSLQLPPPDPEMGAFARFRDPR